MSRVVTMSLASSQINPSVSHPIVSLTRLLIPLITVCVVAGIGSGRLQAQQVISPWSIVTGSGAGMLPTVNVFDGGTLVLTNSFQPYGTKTRGGEVHVAMGDVNGDTFIDIITAPGAGAGGGPHVKVFSGLDGRELLSFFAFDPSFRGGIFVAAGDVNNDGQTDIIVSAGPGGGPHVRVFDGATQRLGTSFLAFDQGFLGGVRVAAGDVNGDGAADIIVAAGPGGGPHVRVFSGVDSSELQSFFAYDPAFTGGVFVASGDITGDGVDDIITGADAGGGPHVRVFDGLSAQPVASFPAYSPNFLGGVRVATGDVNGDGRADIITGTGAGGKGEVRIFDGRDLSLRDSVRAYENGFCGAIFAGGYSAPAPR